MHVGGGEFPLWGYFLMWQSFFSTWEPCYFFRVGGSHFLHGGGGHYWACPPITIFCGSLFLSQIFLIFRIVEVSIFFEGAIRSAQKTWNYFKKYLIKIHTNTHQIALFFKIFWEDLLNPVMYAHLSRYEKKLQYKKGHFSQFLKGPFNS